jgi:hypothetical protein
MMEGLAFLPVPDLTIGIHLLRTLCPDDQPEAKKPKLDTDYISEQNNTEISKKKEAFTDVKTDKEISISSGADHVSRSYTVYYINPWFNAV